MSADEGDRRGFLDGRSADPEIGREWRNAATGEISSITRVRRSGDDILVRLEDLDWWSWRYFRCQWVPTETRTGREAPEERRAS